MVNSLSWSKVLWNILLLNYIQMMTSKKCFVTSGMNSDSHPSNFKPSESNAFSSFRSKYGAASPHAAVSNATNPKPNAAAGFRREDERSCNGKIPRSPDTAKYDMAIPAVPLRSVPIDAMKRKPKKPASSHGNDHDEGQKNAKTCSNTVNQEDDLWKQEVDKLEVVIAEAKEFIHLLDAKYSTPITFPAVEDLRKDPVVESKDQHSSLNSDAFPLHTSIDQRLSRKRLKVGSGVSVVVQAENATGTETMPEDDDGDEVSLLSRAEWIASQLRVNRKDKHVNKHQGVNIVDFIDPVYVATEADQPGGRFPKCDLTGTKCSDLQGNGSMEPGECSPISEGEQYDDASKMFPDEDEASVTYSINNGHACLENHKEFVNLEIVQHDDPRGRKVMEALKLFKEEYNKVSQDHECTPRDGKIMKGPHFIAAERVKAKGMNFSPDKPFGHIPGIEIGDEFSFRAELTIVGLNRQFTPGIDFVTLNGTQYATSVVNSGRYENKAEENDILIYYGQGGNPNVSVNVASDQSLREEILLCIIMNMGFPVRVIEKRKGPMESKTLGVNDKRDYVYVYDGLYKVNKYWYERGSKSSKWVYKFELQRLPGQPRVCGTHVELGKQIPATPVFDGDDAKLGKYTQAKDDHESMQEKENLKVVNGMLGQQRRKQVPARDICVLDDISQGKENFKVCAMNRMDDDHPPPFTYTTNVVYPRWHWRSEPVGCDCIDGCADSVQCPCVKKNGGEIPYTEKGRLMKANTDRVIHECGPSCKCPPTCMNRVSQGGLRFQLEIFKTKSMGWGVRSRNYMEPGSFICEYIGELLDENEADKRIGKDEYLFDICHGKSQEDDFALDAAKFGNVGRFINHSCDPNVFAQKVFHDHDDERMPHIMFFAGKRIPPGQELMYDYNYTKGRVRDANGKIKRKACSCGSRKCTGRLY
ncbi:LOW QUALITY PROTEIN: histone-lysine N-methyltransferase, H3 lysine-9 specific SUVH5-like [Salvia miltiorrhiza]|uniref:LOW QUALITY PROTEIN: histone-lysine N-methyltransferase, H3 lysine-9 specific SUVH5-like n=1 Tax=Salvia miltiorrhiza TaxID=226208 RepID=UPI0025ABB682|nr:LOW QUALITY PROTEIN: histone-lysine N-methyltransferase, H3 lysine-9 specific SUVH5-like [Salvia miltiorrhiza]